MDVAVDDRVYLLQIHHAIHPSSHGRDKNDLGPVSVLLHRGEDGRIDGENLVAIIPKRDQKFIDKLAVQVKIRSNPINSRLDYRRFFFFYKNWTFRLLIFFFHKNNPLFSVNENAYRKSYPPYYAREKDRSNETTVGEVKFFQPSFDSSFTKI